VKRRTTASPGVAQERPQLLAGAAGAAQRDLRLRGEAAGEGCAGRGPAPRRQGAAPWSGEGFGLMSS